MLNGNTSESEGKSFVTVCVVVMICFGVLVVLSLISNSLVVLVLGCNVGIESSTVVSGEGETLGSSLTVSSSGGETLEELSSSVMGEGSTLLVSNSLVVLCLLYTSPSPRDS